MSFNSFPFLIIRTTICSFYFILLNWNSSKLSDKHDFNVSDFMTWEKNRQKLFIREFFLRMELNIISPMKLNSMLLFIARKMVKDHLSKVLYLTRILWSFVKIIVLNWVSLTTIFSEQLIVCSVTPALEKINQTMEFSKLWTDFKRINLTHFKLRHLWTMFNLMKW